MPRDFESMSAGNLQKLKDALAIKLGGRTQDEARKQTVCVSCQEPVVAFRDALSRKEYGISGLCQVCQDQVFGGE